MDLILGMYTVYSRLSLSNRILLRNINKHLNTHVIYTNKEIEAKETIVKAFRRMKIYNLLGTSIHDTEEWKKRHWRLKRDENYDLMFRLPLMLCCLDRVQFAMTKWQIGNMDVIDFINIVVPKSDEERTLEVVEYGLNYNVLFKCELDNDVDFVRINMNSFPLTNCTNFLREIVVRVNGCNNLSKLYVGHMYQDRSKLRLERGSNINQITVDAFSGFSRKRIGEFPRLRISDSGFFGFVIEKDVKN